MHDEATGRHSPSATSLKISIKSFQRKCSILATQAVRAVPNVAIYAINVHHCGFVMGTSREPPQTFLEAYFIIF